MLSAGAPRGFCEPPVAAELLRAKAGPWGLIEFNYLYLEAPDELVATFPVPNSQPRWFFPAAKESDLKALFEQAKLPAAMVARMFEKTQMLAVDGAVTFFPTVAEIEAMTPEARKVIYSRLARTDRNVFHADPVVFTGGDVDAWLRDARIRPELKEKMRLMAYRRGNVPVFSDVEVLLSYAQSDAEVRRIMKLVTRVRTLVARVKVTPDTDFVALYEYWSDQRRSRSIRPFLDSIAENPGDTSLDVIHLLPALPRRLLYTYPTFDLATSGRLPDCHWTSLNFFSRNPNAYYLDSRLASAHVVETYAKVSAPYRFGDVLFFINASGGAIHSCVYVADDIVYTKNGDNALTPWILMRMPNVIDIYSEQPGLQIQGYRRKS